MFTKTLVNCYSGLISDRPFTNLFYFLQSATSWSYCIKASQLVQGVTLERKTGLPSPSNSWG